MCFLSITFDKNVFRPEARGHADSTYNPNKLTLQGPTVLLLPLNSLYMDGNQVEDSLTFVFPHKRDDKQVVSKAHGSHTSY